MFYHFYLLLLLLLLRLLFKYYNSNNNYYNYHHHHHHHHCYCYCYGYSYCYCYHGCTNTKPYSSITTATTTTITTHTAYSEENKHTLREPTFKWNCFLTNKHHLVKTCSSSACPNISSLLLSSLGHWTPS